MKTYTKKYELVLNDTKVINGRTLYRIRALVAIAATVVTPTVTVGDLGGYIERVENLAAEGDAWVSGNAQVSGDAQVSGNARVYGNAHVSGDAQVSGDARVYARNHLGWMSCVGSENGTLCWFLERDRTVHVNRGCFSGSLEEFRSAVEKTHGDGPIGQQYRILIQFIELRSTEAIKDYVPGPSELEA